MQAIGGALFDFRFARRVVALSARDSRDESLAYGCEARPRGTWTLITLVPAQDMYF